jgi:5-formyltetrahydrofolate cyclo-ligase
VENNSKKNLRLQLKSIILADCLAKTQAITNFIITLPEFLVANCVYVFMSSFRNEPDLTQVIKVARSINKTIYTPVLLEKTIAFTRFDEGSELKKNRFGISEASGSVFNDLEADIIFIPCLGFDHNLNRLGRGLGCYDKYLKSSSATKICVAYSDYKVVDVFANNLDVKMDIIITDKGVLRRNA